MQAATQLRDDAFAVGRAQLHEQPTAVQRLLDAKVRGRDMPPPVLIADASLAGAKYSRIVR